MSTHNNQLTSHKIHQKHLIKMLHYQKHLNLWIKFQWEAIITINLVHNLMRNQSVKETLTCHNFLKDNKHQ